MATSQSPLEPVPLGGARPRVVGGNDAAVWESYSVFRIVGLIVAIPVVVTYLLGLWWWVALILLPLSAPFTFAIYFFTRAYLDNSSNAGDPEEHFEFRDAEFGATWARRKIPLETLFEAYFDEKVDFKGDVLATLLKRNRWASMRFTLNHVRFLFKRFGPDVLLHTQSQDHEQVVEHYDRGNDFYRAFLGPMMVYTSGIALSESDSLETMQQNKLDIVFDKIQLKRGEKLLDIGCGWGTLVLDAAKRFDAHATGVTLAKEQVMWATELAGKIGVQDRVEFLRMDYRDIPRVTYDKITCLEMAEHVGVKNFRPFLKQIRSMLNDDGVFYMQVAGIRRAWQYEDFIWGLFMNKYIFPGADASTPLMWYIYQLENAGYEVQNVDTVGSHYSRTIEHWYYNWLRAEPQMRKKYGTRLTRVWTYFLAHSSVIAMQGSASCYQITCHKNVNAFDRTTFWTDRLAPRSSCTVADTPLFAGGNLPGSDGAPTSVRA